MTDHSGRLADGRAKPPAPPRRARRRFLLAAAGGSLAFPMIAAAQPATLLRFQGAWPAKDVRHEYALDYAKKASEMSGGRLRIEMLSAGAVVKPPDLIDAVSKGALDGCHATPAFWSGKDPAFSLFGSGPDLGMDGNLLLAWMEHGGGRPLYEQLYSQAFRLNVQGFLYGAMPAPPLGWFRRAPGSAADFKGLRVHVASPGAPAELFRMMGASLLDLEYEDVMPAARGGRVDAVAFSNPTSDRQLGLPDAFPFCLLQSRHQPAPVFEILFNRARFESLPPDLRAIARHAAQASSAEVSWKAAHRYSADHAAMRQARGRRLLRTPQGVLRAQLQGWSAVVDRGIRGSPAFEKIFRSQQLWARRVVRWVLDTGVDPRAAWNHWFAQQEPAGRP